MEMLNTVPFMSPKEYLKVFGLDELPSLDKAVIMTFNRDMFNTLKSFTEPSCKGAFECKKQRRDFFDINYQTGCSRVFLSGDGGPATAFAMEICIARGAKAFIGVGFTVSLSPDELAVGDIYIPMTVMRNDGISTKYLPLEFPVSGSAQIIQNIISRFGESQNIKTGMCCCTDSFFMHSVDEVKKWKLGGAKSIDMESGAFYSVAQYYGVPAVLINVVAEELDNGQWKVDYPKARETVQAIYNNYDKIIEAVNNVTKNRVT